MQNETRKLEFFVGSSKKIRYLERNLYLVKKLWHVMKSRQKYKCDFKKTFGLIEFGSKNLKRQYIQGKECCKDLEGYKLG